MLADDESNAVMTALVRTSGKALTPRDDTYDFIAIGGGTAGLVATGGLALLGARTAIIEREMLGGDCLVTGCVPSKALIHAGRVAHDAREAARWGIHTGGVSVDFPEVMRRLRATRSEIASDDSIDAAQERGVDVIAGEARFTSANTVRVGDATIRFKRALVATGSRPRMPEIDGLPDVRPLTNESVFELTERPERLLVIGGGPIGCELAQAMQRLGCAVTLAQRGAQLLPRDDPEAAELITERLREEGVRVLLNANVQQVEERLAHVSVDAETVKVPFDRVLVATGRIPNIESLDLEAAGIATADEGIVVDARLRTTNTRVYAAGDIAGGMPNFTHAAWAGAEYAALNAFFPAFLDAKNRVIPWATYTDPEVAHVGPSARQLRTNGVAFDTLTVRVHDNDRAHIEGERSGFARVHLARGTDRVLAGTIVGRQAGELIVELATALTQKIGLQKLVKTVRPYPTRSEMVRDLAYAYATGRVGPRTRRLATWWIGLRG